MFAPDVGFANVGNEYPSEFHAVEPSPTFMNAVPAACAVVSIPISPEARVGLEELQLLAESRLN